MSRQRDQGVAVGDELLHERVGGVGAEGDRDPVLPVEVVAGLDRFVRAAQQP
jgi:hypothetical protein